MTSLNTRPLEIFDDLGALSEAAARLVTVKGREAIEERGQFVLALAGGSTPRRLYGLLATDAWRQTIQWERWQFFISDERVVPMTDAASNFGMAQHELFSHVSVSTKQQHPAPTQLGAADAVAKGYEEEIRSFFSIPDDSIPRFDLILLGMGSDGHTASLFPGKPALNETSRLIVPSPPGILPPPVDRITFSFPLINAARTVLFLVAGEDKAVPLKGVQAGDRNVVASRVQPTDGELFWFVDEKAAANG
ncbi:MAG: 6-phosphogluconolactonase [Chloroflexota bacterium]